MILLAAAGEAGMGQGDSLILSHFAKGAPGSLATRQNGTKQTVPLSRLRSVSLRPYPAYRAHCLTR